MGTGELAIRLVAGVFLIAANAFFVAAEFALTRARQLPEEKYQEYKSTRLAWKMTEELEIYLTGCQLGISTTSVLLGVVAEPAVTELIAPATDLLGLSEGTSRTVSVVVAVIIIQLVHKIWGEQAPTYLGVEKPVLVARFTAPGHYVFSKVFSPIIRAGDGLAKSTLRLFGVEITRSWVEAEEGSSAGDDEEATGGKRTPRSTAELRQQVLEVLGRTDMPRDRQREVERAVQIDDIPVRRIMVDRDEVAFLDLEADPADNRRTLAKEPKSRFPLVRGSLDDFVGIVYVHSIFEHLDAFQADELDLSSIASDPLRLPADCPVADAIDTFQEEKQELALVEEEGRIVGLLTVTDAVEAIIGELEDPHD